MRVEDKRRLQGARRGVWKRMGFLWLVSLNEEDRGRQLTAACLSLILGDDEREESAASTRARIVIRLGIVCVCVCVCVDRVGRKVRR